MHSSENKDLTPYNVLDKKLAELLGWTYLQIGGMDGDLKVPSTWLIGYAPNTDPSLGKEPAPKWSRDIGAAAKLAIDHGVKFGEYVFLGAKNGNVYAELDIDPEHTWTLFEVIAEHGNPYIACATAIVNIVIDKLEHLADKKVQEAYFH